MSSNPSPVRTCNPGITEVPIWEITVLRRSKAVVVTFDLLNMAPQTPVSAARDMQGRLVIDFDGGLTVGLPDMQGRVVERLEAAPVIEVAVAWADGSMCRGCNPLPRLRAELSLSSRTTATSG
jgi:hypothetical protein